MSRDQRNRGKGRLTWDDLPYVIAPSAPPRHPVFAGPPAPLPESRPVHAASEYKPTLYQGIILFYLQEKGYGYISPDGADPQDRSTNVFFHYLDFALKGYAPGHQERVEFEKFFQRDRNAWRAKNIRPIEEGA